MNRPAKALLGFAIVSLAVYGGLCALLYNKQRALLYFPQPAAPGDPGQTVLLRTTGPRVLVSVREHDGPDAIVYYGGNAELVSRNLPVFSDAFPKHALYLLHYRGYGGSEGKPSEADLYRDAIDLYDYAQQRHRRVFLVGRSLGSGLAVRVASERQPARLLLVTPYDSIVGIAAGHYPYFPVSMLLEERYESFKYAPKVRTPTRILLAENDQVIPPASTEQLYKRFAPGVATLVRVPGAGHGDIGADPRYFGWFIDP